MLVKNARPKKIIDQCQFPQRQIRTSSITAIGDRVRYGSKPFGDARIYFYIQSNEKEELGINDEIHTQDTVIPWQWPVMVNQGYPRRWRFLSFSGAGDQTSDGVVIGDFKCAAGR